jgi:hypothetical protein
MKVSQFNLEKQLDRVHEWIRSADQKISIAFAVENGIIIALSVPVINILLLHPKILESPVIFVLLCETIILLLVAELYAITALIPNVRPRKLGSIVYFGSISNQDYKSYGKSIRSYTRKELEDDLLNQVTISSEIAYKKHNYLKASLNYFTAGILMALALLPTAAALLMI